MTTYTKKSPQLNLYFKLQNYYSILNLTYLLLLLNKMFLAQKNIMKSETNVCKVAMTWLNKFSQLV